MTIYVRTHGGLGNQLFQLAFGLEASYINNTNLILDTSWYKNIPDQSTKRNEYLSKIAPDVLKIEDINEIKLRLKNQASLSQKIGFRKIHIKEKYGEYSSSFMGYEHAYFDGYWHSYKYLIRDLITKKINFDSEQENLVKQYQESILNSNSVMIHIRRGDYLLSNNKNILLTKEYYDRAVQHMLNEKNNIELFIFSDDIDWVKNNWQFNATANYIEKIGFHDSSIEELKLMAMCKNHIIANSTFSWWGAWLGKHQEQIVISPKYWLDDNFKITENLIPKSWLTF
jgi:hypothetical protein